jgi:putative hydrolase of the HAD superfamily
MAIEIIFFDIYGTLAGFDPPREVIQQRAAAHFGMQLSVDGVNAGYRMADHFMAEQNSRRAVRDLPSQERNEFFARYEQLVLQGAGYEVSQNLAGQVWARVREQKYGWALFPDVLPGLAGLEDAGYRVATISNMPYSGSEVAAMLGLAGHVEFVVTSGDAGVEKPDPRIFQAALGRANVGPEQAVMVGDHIGSDLEAAEAVGIRAVLMDRYNHHTDHNLHPRITTLAELPNQLSQE